MFGPYRQAPQQDPRIQQEMQEAVALMWQWRRYSPVIAGGALWAWAAGKRARDVDIFMHSTFWSRRAMKKRFGPLTKDTLGAEWKNQGYSQIAVGMDIEKFATHLACGTPVDLVLTPWKGGEITQHFDYAHCIVAFGVEARVLFGAAFYGDGKIETRHLRIRPPEYVLAKTQPSLWGKGDATVHALIRLMGKLEVELAAQGG